MKITKKPSLFAAAFLIAMLALCPLAQAKLKAYEKAFSKGKVTFFKEESMTPEQFSAAPSNLKPDAAWLQNTSPLTMSMRYAVTDADFGKMTQEEMDQFYIRLTSGPITPGSYQGQVYNRGEALTQIKKFALAKFGKAQVFTKALCGAKDPLECLAEMAWKGKRIYPMDTQTGEHQLRNAIPLQFASVLKTTLLPIGDQIRYGNWLSHTQDMFYGERRNMIFPAHVYCGQSLFDHRRESLVIDYAWGSDFSPYIKGLDNLVGRDFLDIRDEIRMVRPGLYFGRAYIQKIFVLNFTLHSTENDRLIPNEVPWPVDACFNASKSTR